MGGDPLDDLGRHVGADQLALAADAREVQDRHDAGQDRHVDAAGADPLDQREVVRGPEEHLGDRELRAGAGLGDQHVGVVVERLGRRVALGERRDADAEVAAAAGQLDELLRRR